MSVSTYFGPSPVFAPRNFRKTGRYLFPEEVMTAAVNGSTDLICPLVVDTEYTQDSWEAMLEGGRINGRRGVTVQIKGIHDGPAAIFAHPDQAQYAHEVGETLRHPVLATPFAPIDYLGSLGIQINIHREIDAENIRALMNLPKFEFCIYAHFALVELFMMVIDQYYKEDIKNKIMLQKIEHEKRLRASSSFSDSVAMPWSIIIDQHEFCVYLSFIDTCFIHNQTKYSDFCKRVGLSVEDKELIQGDDFKRMDQVYFEKPANFDKYAIGDLQIYDALKANSKYFNHIWDELDIGEYWSREPHLTMGANMNEIFVAKLLKLFGIAPNRNKDKNNFLQLFKPSTVEYLKTRTNTTEAMLSKIDGGRCRNNRPTLVKLHESMVDIDLSSCYGESMRNQVYPIGRPITIKFDQDSNRNHAVSLREFLDSLKWGKPDCELLPGLWFARVSTPPGYQLRYAQDFLASWYDWKKAEIDNFPASSTHLALQEMLNELDGKSGTVKIFTHEIQNAVITHDFIQWLEFICGQKQRNELFNMLFIQTAIIYPKSERCNSTQEFLDRHNNHQGKNTCELEIGCLTTEQIITTRECFAWYGVGLDELIVNDLMEFRKCHPKKTPLNELYKLCVNSLFGVCTSSHMKTSNIVVGNNLTARARAAIWYVEKGLHCIQTITDGGVFDLNHVVHVKPTRSRLTSSDLVHLYRKQNPNVRLGPLGDHGKISFVWQGDTCTLHFQGSDKALTGEEARKWVNDSAWVHLRGIFPNVDVLHQANQRIKDAKLVADVKTVAYETRIGQFEFEMKDFYDYGHFHASANYLINNTKSQSPVTKFRSYDVNRKDQIALLANRHNRIEKSSRYQNDTPAVLFLKGLAVPNTVARADVFIRPMILKINNYTNTKTRWDKTLLVPGDVHFQFGLIREFSLSQFTFRSICQFKKIEKQYILLRSEYGQSFEIYFIDDNNHLDFQRMVKTLDDLIVDGCLDIKKELDKHRHPKRFALTVHPAAQVLRLAKRLYQKALQGTEGEPDDEPFADLISDGLDVRLYDLADYESF
ncbi:MAG: hypothetical protein H7836_01590 [Magnetococcus sp. YQC-3]